MSWDQVQALLLRPAREPAVAHFLLRVRPRVDAPPPDPTKEEVICGGGAALKELEYFLGQVPTTIGDQAPVNDVHCTVGFTYRGLEALCLPPGYLQVFQRLAPAFAQGAPLRAARLGDSGASAPARWLDAFDLDRAHVLITLHGKPEVIEAQAQQWQAHWAGQDGPLECVGVLRGQRLGAPAQRKGQWVHFGYRDGLVDHHIEGVERTPARDAAKASDVEPLPHAAGEFLLGHVNDNGYNAFALPLAPREVRSLFHDSSFGVLRPMEQDVPLFEEAIARWQAEAEAKLGQPLHPDWVKAKLCGRWPDGQVLLAGQREPKADPVASDLRLAFTADAQGVGCPWSSHVRRMDPRGHAGAGQHQRALLRRGVPYGKATWDAAATPGPRGLLGLFFCASLEDQFEQFLGQWANGPPPGGAWHGAAADPFAAMHPDRRAEAAIPLANGATLALQGFRSWTRTLGTAYTWHPGREGLRCLLGQLYLPPKEAPWL